MKGGKDEEKIMIPLFPRLHINHVEKGGSRTPLKNKMATSFTSGSASMLPLLPNNTENLVPSTSSSHGGGHERSFCYSFCTSSPSHHLAERLHSYSSAQCSWFQPPSFSSSKDSPVEKLRDEDDFRVPTFPQSGRTPNCGDGRKNMDREELTFPSLNASMKLRSACEKQTKRTSTTDRESNKHLRIETEENPKVSQTSPDCASDPASILSNGDKILANSFSSLPAKDRVSEQAKGAHVSLNQKKRSNLVDNLWRSHDSNAQSHQEYRSRQENKALRDGVSAESKRAIEKRNASALEGVSCSKPSLRDNHRIPNRLENVSEFNEDWESGSLQVGDVDRNGDISDTSVVDSISGSDISLDDFVGGIGQKQFWKARNAMVNQQREFAEQVFELHRLIKVQSLLAGSPGLLLKDKLCLGKPSNRISPVKKLSLENVLEPPPLIVKSKDDSQKLNTSAECAAENAVQKPPLHSLNNDTSKGLVIQQSNYEPYLRNASPASIATDAKVAPWCIHPQPGNQWLVPVLSPFEGLVYKPCTRPCPPTAGFKKPVYGSCGPMSSTPVCDDFLNIAYGIPASPHQGIGTLPGTPPIGQTYFPPVSSSAVEQLSPSTRAQSNKPDNQLFMGDINFTMPYQSLCNMSSQKSRVIPCCVRNLQSFKGSELQGNTASSPERVQGDPLPLFSTAPTVQFSDQPVWSQCHSTEQRTRVIKVVPHSPRSASKSAAQIFRSIQNERKQHDSFG
uniref:Putative Hydroxyproline-rich glycoprotein family protein n=1 Tax=Davidia involucrata TaxID=16924 RepID=A0A5B7BG22_DAVIN